ncbi:hypothetical protein HNY73_012722 [Argiope bruennichi]|uniref:Uncharacterized protein n=1 Tax=Argiope bruennichi TaxID=94029 RepID=A0A8T0EVU0_ARGBR|nr:hypothetical protein HNY73_012722 [Argiope bruennichi]
MSSESHSTDESRILQKGNRYCQIQRCRCHCFPEYGIFPPGDREQLKDYWKGPDQKGSTPTPVKSRGQFPKTFLHLELLGSNLYSFVAKQGGTQKCKRCPGPPSEGFLF